MPDIQAVLESISSSRRADPFAPVTVIAPSQAAALQQRRRLAELGPFAAVRFETLPRIAELLGAGILASQGRVPLARPIGDYVAENVARQASASFARVRDLPGFARTLRHIFSRLRRGGIVGLDHVPGSVQGGHFREILRLYDLFRQQTASFYDSEDLLDAAADVVEAGASIASELGVIYLAPPGCETAAGNRFVGALGTVSEVIQVDEAPVSARQRFSIAPDPASEAREVARTVLAEIEAGAAIDSIAVFHGADESYSRLLREAFEVAGVPSAPLPGVPLADLPAGRGVLLLAGLPIKDYSRTAIIEFLTVAPLREWLPGGDGRVHEASATWDKISREAGITHGIDTWRRRLEALGSEQEQHLRALAPDYETRQRAMEFEADQTRKLRAVMDALIERLQSLRLALPAASFIERFKAVIAEYIDHEAQGLGEVIEEIDQLGTVDEVGGSFSLESFARAIDANLRVRTLRTTSLGDGIAIADYRLAAGLKFDCVVLCGAYEGGIPSGPGTDALLDDSEWRQLKSQFPWIEDSATRVDRGKKAAERAATAAARLAIWSVPSHEPGGTREYYPAPVMAAAFSAASGEATTASNLRRHAKIDGVLSRALSPLATMLRGPVLDLAESDLRNAVLLRRHGREVDGDHPRRTSLDMLQARRGADFSAWDGNLAGLPNAAALQLTHAVSPTSLENYSSCGFKYLCRSVLRLNVVEEPDDRETIDAAERGSLIHKALERFFTEEKDRGRPGVDEAWNESDRERLLAIAVEEFSRAAQRGLTGLEIYGQHDLRSIQADLSQFLVADTDFRHQTGAVPWSFEQAIPESEVAGVRLRGYVDRIDRSPDGKSAWVIDYKTGGTASHKDITADNPFASGTKLQLPAYITAVPDADRISALYWFIGQKGGFKQITYEPSPEWDATFRETMLTIVQGIQAGAFPAVPGEEDEFYGGYTNCRYCDFARICSQRRDVEFAEKSSAPGMEPWKRVADAARGEAE